MGTADRDDDGRDAFCMSKSKVYIDFGNHPGKDRIPREAAISGCIVITGKRGAAAFAEDVCIPETYKFDESCAKKKILYHASGIVSVILMCTRLILTVTEVILEMNISNLLQM